MEEFDPILGKIDEIECHGFDKYMPPSVAFEFCNKMRTLRAIVKYEERELMRAQEVQEQIEDIRYW